MTDLFATIEGPEDLESEIFENSPINANIEGFVMAGVKSWNGQTGDVEFDGYTKTETDSLLNEKADAADLSAVATSGNYNDLNNKPNILEPLIGYSTDITPTQVLNAIQDGRTVCLTHINEVFGLLKFTYFVYSQGMNLVFATAVIFTASPYGVYNATINGYLSSNTWSLTLMRLATLDEIPTNVSELINDAGYATQTWVQQQGYLTSAPVISVNGRAGAVTVTEGLEPLIGLTTAITPSQVLAALQEGRAVYLTHIDNVYGVLSFNYFGYSMGLNLIFAQSIIVLDGGVYSASIYGDLTNETWALATIPLMKHSSLNVSYAYVPNVTSVGAASSWAFVYDDSTEEIAISGANGTAPTLGSELVVVGGVGLQED